MIIYLQEELRKKWGMSQRRVAVLCSQNRINGAKILLSNSGPKNTDPNDNFFDDLYSDFEVKRVEATK